MLCLLLSPNDGFQEERVRRLVLQRGIHNGAMVLFPCGGSKFLSLFGCPNVHIFQDISHCSQQEEVLRVKMYQAKTHVFGYEEFKSGQVPRCAVPIFSAVLGTFLQFEIRCVFRGSAVWTFSCREGGSYRCCGKFSWEPHIVCLRRQERGNCHEKGYFKTEIFKS